MDKIKLKNKNSGIAGGKRGFSIVELMIVVAIIGIMSTVVMVSFNSPKSGVRLKAAQSEFVSAIKLAQSYALQGKIPPNGDKASAYGVSFTNNTKSYVIFYTDSDGDRTLESYSLADKNVTLASSVGGGGRFLFSVPDGNFSGSAATVTLTYNGTTRQIQISSGGAIVEN